ncbi:MAG: ABC transporter ATP-binding protein [Bacteroidales bacterium]|nr:ABC transporter ATP-binding protein [Bacteroidales bacterium]
MNDFLILNGFSCGYKNSFKLSDISFSVPKGDFAGIVGPNGSGKTTLLKGITSELKLLRGTVSLNNMNLPAMSLMEKARNIAVVSQFSEVADIPVEDYVLMGRLPYRTRWQFFETQKDLNIAERYMNLTNTIHLRHKLMTQLSGGELQLASIARALTQEPELLLLDEPTSHLDITHQVQILNLIQQLNVELNLTVLMVIHDLNLAGEYCDHLIMMKAGKVYLKGDPHEVLNYNHIEKVYNTVVITQENPLSGKPVVFLVSNKVTSRKKGI